MKSSKDQPWDFARNVEAFSDPVQCLNDIVQAWTEYLKIAEEEKTKRREIAAWEKATIAEIQAKRDILMKYLDCSFDERARNFHLLFEVADTAISSQDNQKLGFALTAIVELAKSNPLKDMADLANVKKALDDPDYVWEL